jgi:hypothetical protein
MRCSASAAGCCGRFASRATAVVDEAFAVGPARPSRHYGMVDGHPVSTPSLVAWLLTAAESGIAPDRLAQRDPRLDRRQKVLRTVVSRAVGGEPRLFKDEAGCASWRRWGLGEPEIRLLARCRGEEGYPVDPPALRTAIARTLRLSWPLTAGRSRRGGGYLRGRRDGRVGKNDVRGARRPPARGPVPGRAGVPAFGRVHARTKVVNFCGNVTDDQAGHPIPQALALRAFLRCISAANWSTDLEVLARRSNRRGRPRQS